MKIGITSVLGKNELAGLKNLADLALLDPDKATPGSAAGAEEPKCDQLVLLAHANPKKPKSLADVFPSSIGW